MLHLLPLIVYCLSQTPPSREDILTANLGNLPGTYLAQYHGARAHAAAAIAAEDGRISAEILLSLSYTESHFHPRSAGHGKWPVSGDDFPRNRRHYICGYAQTTELSVADCLAVRDPLVSYRHAVSSIGRWYDRCVKSYGVKGHSARVLCALRGHARGGRAAAGTCSGLGDASKVAHCRWAAGYAERVAGRAKLLGKLGGIKKSRGKKRLRVT